MGVSAGIPVTAVGFALSSRVDDMFGGFAQILNQVQQECQGMAVGGLHWREVSSGVWEAVAPVTLVVHEIGARPD